MSTRGFTLLEVLVAFVIAALALGVLARAGIDGMSGAALSGRYQEALVRAQSHLAAIGRNPAPGDRQGDEGDQYHWRVRIVPVSASALAQAAPRTVSVGQAPPPAWVTLLSVSVAVSWGDGPARMVELDSERAVPGQVR